MTGRLVRSADFERVLRNPPRAKTPHFAIHYLAERPSVATGRSEPAKLSTAGTGLMLQPVDGLPSQALVADGLWWGVVVPKRHARRSVTRTLLKRRMRMAMTLQGEQLDKGLWVIRLRAPFDRTQFLSAASDALASAVSDELSQALRHAAKPARR